MALAYPDLPKASAAVCALAPSPVRVDAMSPLPILYSFRRCPYAMRARLGVLFAGLQVELREVTLKNKPAPMLAISPKGTVPVLRLVDGAVIEESRDIMVWALEQQDPQGLLDATILDQANALIEQNDNEFKHWLDRYKYADRHAHGDIGVRRWHYFLVLNAYQDHQLRHDIDRY